MAIKTDEQTETTKTQTTDIIEDFSKKVLENISEKGDTEVPSKTWKSTVAFFLFLFIYAYTVYDNRSAEIIDITGYISLISMAFMMLRDKRLGDLIDRMVSLKLNKQG